MLIIFDKTTGKRINDFGKHQDYPMGIDYTPQPNEIVYRINDNDPWVSQYLLGDISNVTATIVNGEVTSINIPAYVLPLSVTKQKKIAELAQKRDETLNGGFKSSATGTLYTYSSDQPAQANFDGEFAFLNSAVSTDTTVDWYTWENGMVSLTKAQFNQVYSDGRTFKKSAWTKYANLEAQANAATTVDAVNAITW